VKTASPIPKEKLFEAMELVNRLEVSLPVRIGDVLMEDLFGAKLVATANAE
jgi:CxxC motif-containing protein